MLLSVVCVIVFASTAKCANILAIVPAPFYSHQIAFTQVWRQLSLRGHQVTLITTVPLRDPRLTNLTEIDMSNCLKIVSEKYSITKTAENILTMWNWYDIFAQINREAAEEQLSHPQVQELIHKKNNHFDVVFVESYFPEFLAFGRIFNCPTILVTSVDGHTEFHRAMGNPAHPVLHADYATSFHGKLNFKERVISTIYSMYVLYFERFHVNPAKQKIIDKYFTNMTVSLYQLISEVDMLFLDVNPVIQGPRAIGPTTINIGMERKLLSKKPLPQDLKDFMDNATEGFIYLSLGSNVRSQQLSSNSVYSIMEAFREVPYKVLWKFETDNDTSLGCKPDNVRFMKWAPQEIILKHPNIKLFITQGGLQSLEEATYSKVPLVVVPYFADQFKNARLIEVQGIGIKIGRKPSIKKEELKNAILEVITNPKYKRTISELGDVALDMPITGLEKAIWWTEYTIRHKGAKHLRNPAADIPFYQYYLLDVTSFILFMSVVFFTIMFKFLTILYLLVRKLCNVFIAELYVQQTKTKKLE